MELVTVADAARVGGGADLGGPKIGDAGLGALGGATGIVGARPGGNLVYAGHGAAERGGVEGLGGSELGDGLGNSDLGGLGGMLGAEKGV